MTTIINSGESSGTNALMVVLCVVVLAVIGFGAYYFMGNSSGSSTSTTVNMPAPSAPAAPAAPAPAAPAAPSSN